MRQFVLNNIEFISKISVIVILLVGTLLGFSMDSIFGAFIGLITAFVVNVVIFGAVFLLIDIKDNTVALRHLLEKHKNS